MSGPYSRVVPIADGPEGGYVPGACNIGPWEARRRRLAAVGAFMAALLLLAGLVAVGAPVLARGLVLLPAWGGMVSWLQARRRFCVAYARAGISNFGDTLDDRRSVTDPAQRAADRRATVALVRDAFLLALLPTVAAVVLPL